jgi:hypothetical protein
MALKNAAKKHAAVEMKLVREKKSLTMKIACSFGISSDHTTWGTSIVTPIVLFVDGATVGGDSLAPSGLEILQEAENSLLKQSLSFPALL